MKHSLLWIVGIVVVIILGFLWWYTSRPTPEAKAPVGTVMGEEEEFVDDSKDGAASGTSAYTVHYMSTGFSPSSISVPVGATVTFLNEGTEEMWVGSDEHPSHTQYAGTNKDEHCVDGQPSVTAFDQCGVGESYSFTFTKAGTWGYHNHRESDHHGSVVVE